ncbi:Multidrug resistance protein Stp [Alcanivorax sp. ALC70]|nr:Multidrug resistance protein Stp [Alcanivorax sp. ALC70]
MPESSTPADPRAEHDGLPARQRRLAMLAIATSIGMSVMDSNIVNVALPTIANSLDVGRSDVVWVVNAYLLAVALTLLPLSSLGDIVGYRRIYRVGLGLFIVASLVCTLADSLVTLAVARFFQGLGAAGVMSVNAALVRFIYPARFLGRGIGLSAMVVALSSALGPTVAAGILSVADWPWLFAVNVPVGGLALYLASRNLPRTPTDPRPFDWISALLNALAIGLLVSAVDGLAHGMAVAPALAALAAAGLVGTVLVRRQLSQPSPLLPVDLLRIRPFALAIGTSFCSFTSQMAAFIALPFYFHDVLGYSAMQTGLLMTPWPAAVMVAAPLAGRLADRYPIGVLCSLGLLAKVVGLVLLALLSSRASLPVILACMALCGLGFGFFQAPNNRAIIGSAPRHRSGGAGGMQGTTRLLGQTLGAALTALAFSLVEDAIAPALLMAAGFSLCAALVSLFRIRSGNPA